MNCLEQLEDRLAAEHLTPAPASDWIRVEDQLPADGQLVAVLHTEWGAPAACVATYTSGEHQEWYAAGLILHRVHGWLPLPPLELPT